ncbi:MAG: flavodoxin [Candidatus Micrarchaeia archaeon]
MPSKVLVVFYSRSGVTAAVANIIAKELGADIERIMDKKNREGLIGILRTGKDVFLHHLSEIESPAKDPSQYDVVIIGTPVWAGTMSLPVKAYITRMKHKFGKIAFFCTGGGFGAKNTIKDMSYLCGRQPIAVMCISHMSYFTGGYKKSIAKFVEDIRKQNP